MLDRFGVKATLWRCDNGHRAEYKWEERWGNQMQWVRRRDKNTKGGTHPHHSLPTAKSNLVFFQAGEMAVLHSKNNVAINLKTLTNWIFAVTRLLFFQPPYMIFRSALTVHQQWDAETRPPSFISMFTSFFKLKRRPDIPTRAENVLGSSRAINNAVR